MHRGLERVLPVLDAMHSPKDTCVVYMLDKCI